MKSWYRERRARVLRRLLWRRSAAWALPGGPLLVVAPHPDDETFGCGGAIARCCAAGMPVRILFLTDGERALAHAGVGPEVVAAARRRQAGAATAVLGLAESALTWLHLPDGELAGLPAETWERAVAAVAAAAAGVVAVYVTHPADGWADHTVAAVLTAAAMRRLSPAPELRHYPVWLWRDLPARRFGWVLGSDVTVFDDADSLAVKRRAAACYLAEQAPGTDDPFCGRLPPDLLDACLRPPEFLFAAAPSPAGGR